MKFWEVGNSEKHHAGRTLRFIRESSLKNTQMAASSKGSLSILAVLKRRVEGWQDSNLRNKISVKSTQYHPTMRSQGAEAAFAVQDLLTLPRRDGETQHAWLMYPTDAAALAQSSSTPKGSLAHTATYLGPSPQRVGSLKCTRVKAKMLWFPCPVSLIAGSDSTSPSPFIISQSEFGSHHAFQVARAKATRSWCLCICQALQYVHTSVKGWATVPPLRMNKSERSLREAPSVAIHTSFIRWYNNCFQSGIINRRHRSAISVPCPKRSW